MRTPNWIKTITVALGSAVMLVACRDSSVAPVAADQRPAMGVVTVRWVGDTAYSTFTYDPNRPDSYMLVDGVHRIHFSSHAVCDPATSSYGPGEWDKPCTPLTSPITITGKSYVNTLGRTQIEFSPELRFVPSSDAGKGVWLKLKDKGAAVPGQYNIQWCPKGSELECVDESVADASLVTGVNPRAGFLKRRIKHFSGYVIALGYSVPSEEAW